MTSVWPTPRASPERNDEDREKNRKMEAIVMDECVVTDQEGFSPVISRRMKMQQLKLQKLADSKSVKAQDRPKPPRVASDITAKSKQKHLVEVKEVQNPGVPVPSVSSANVPESENLPVPGVESSLECKEKQPLVPASPPLKNAWGSPIVASSQSGMYTRDLDRFRTFFLI
jgi:hypothetical protein